MKALLLSLIAAASVLTVTAGTNACLTAKASVKKSAANFSVAIIIAPDKFRDEELRVPLNALKKAGADVTVFSKKLGEITGMLGYKFKPDKKLSKLKVKSFDAIVFIGGSGAKTYWNDKLCHEICKEAVAKNKILAAICIAPVTLAKAGVLKNKKATVWRGVSKMLIANGVKYVNKPLVIDGKIITANGPKAAGKFAAAIISKLKAAK